MSSASSMAIRQFHSWLDPSKIDPKTHLWCENCKGPRHTIDTCWQIHDSSSSTNMSPAAVSNTTMCTVAQQGISIQPNIPWIIDSGASDHMTGQSQLFHPYLPSSGLNKVCIVDGSFSPIAGKGKIALTPTLTLSSVMHVPKLSCNLFSVSKFTETNNCVAKFFPSYYEFQDLGSGKTIGNAGEIKGLYYFDDGAIREEQVQVAKKVSSVSDEIRLWHWCLRHPNFPYLLFLSLFKNINMSQFNYEVCELAKHLILIKNQPLLLLFIVIFGVHLMYLICLILVGLSPLLMTTLGCVGSIS